MDAAHEYTSRAIDTCHKDMEAVYSRAKARCSSLLTKYMRKHEAELRERFEASEDGTISKEEFRAFALSVMSGREWNELVARISEEMLFANMAGLEVVNGSLADVYAEGFNFGVYQTEGGE